LPTFSLVKRSDKKLKLDNLPTEFNGKLGVNKMLSESVLLEKEVGDIICKTKSDHRPLLKWIFMSLYELLFKGIFNKNFFHNLVLVREKDSSTNLYDISSDALKNGKITSHSLVSNRKDGLQIPISSISEIIHYNSPLYKLILKSNKVYCICIVDRNWTRKELFLLKDDKIISKIQEFATADNRNFLYHESNDLYLIYFLLNRFAGVLILALLTYGAMGLTYFATIDLIKNFSLPPIIIIGVTILIYYFLVIRIFAHLVYYVFPKTIFRTKTVSNNIS